MRQKNNDELMQTALDVARRAALAVMDIYAQGEAEWAVLHKSDGSPLTQADRLAHSIITAGLNRHFPKIPIVSEEDEDYCVEGRGREFWLVDPLDGTKEFLARSGEFTVNIAFVRDDRPVFGVVVAPALGQTYWGGAEIGAFRETNGCTESIKIASRVIGEPLRIVASKSHMNAETMAFISRFGAYELVQAGSSLKFCRVAEGVADIYPRLGATCEWDTAAAHAILEGAGGCVCRLDGQALQYGKAEVLNPHFIASAFSLVV